VSSQPSHALHWLSLLGLSLGIAIALEMIGAPAAFMLGAMIAGSGLIDLLSLCILQAFTRCSELLATHG
jgi:uncharacterized membrane protein AbrB (regulator of aidB expression)